MNYHYCGECQKCFPLLPENFPGCNRSGCKNVFYYHPSGHGMYCVYCGIKKKIFVEHNDMYFCDRKCLGVYEKEQTQLMLAMNQEEECQFCNQEKP